MKYKITFLKDFLTHKTGESFELSKTILITYGKNKERLINNIYDLMRKGILKIEVNDTQIKPPD